MSELPRLLAFTTDSICRAPDFAHRAAGLASLGATVGLVVRMPTATAQEHGATAARIASVPSAGGARLLIHARPDLARALGADGVQLRRSDLSAPDSRTFYHGWFGASVHSLGEAEAALDEGADFLVAGNVFATTSHPGRVAQGLAWLTGICGLGKPVYAIGGVNPACARDLVDAGAWGGAVISAVWEAPDPVVPARELLAAWSKTV
jgi:thiamine-phosphate diphosphorylase